MVFSSVSTRFTICKSYNSKLVHCSLSERARGQLYTARTSKRLGWPTLVIMKKPRRKSPTAQCANCDQPAGAADSFHTFAGSYKWLVSRGHCVQCRQPMCASHQGYSRFHDDDCGTWGFEYFCRPCVLTHNAQIEQDNARVRARATWWWYHVPLLGIPMYGLILLCGSKATLSVENHGEQQDSK